MRDGAHRWPGAVPDDGAEATVPAGVGHDAAAADVRWGSDTDGDGRPDTLLTADGADLLVLTDLDGDGLADRVLRIGPDAAVRPGIAHPDAVYPAAMHPGGAHADGAPPAPADVSDPVVGSAPARAPWSTLLGHLFGAGP